MAMRHFAFYPFGKCYFFSKAAIGDEGFFFNDDLVPRCSERGVLKQFQKYILQKILIPFRRPILVVAIWQQIAKKKTLICTLGKAIM